MINGESSGRFDLSTGSVTWGVKHIIIGILLVTLSLFSAAAVALVASELFLEQKDAVKTWVSVHVMGIAIVAIVWCLGLRHTRLPFAEFRLSRVKGPRIRTVLLMFAVLATSLVITSIYSAIVEWLAIDKLSPVIDYSDMLFDGVGVLLTFQAVALITPFYEELFFRWFVFRGLIPKVGPYGSMVFSAAIFSGFHISSLGVLIPIFITGLLLAWLYWRTGSLWASIGVHVGQNTLALLTTALM